jgi:hypothetical protein
MTRRYTKAEFIAMLKQEGILPVYMEERDGTKVLDRIANDNVFSDTVDAFMEDGLLPKHAVDWALSYKDGGA